MAGATEILASLPDAIGTREQVGANLRARGRAFIDLVLSGQALQPQYWPVYSELKDGGELRWVAVFQVQTDAMQVGEPGDSVRFTLCDEHQIALGDALGLVRITGKLEDLSWLQAPIRLQPQTRPVPGMSSNATMLDASRGYDRQLTAWQAITQAPTALRRPVGKIWCPSNANVRTSSGVRRCTNYGLHYATSRTPKYRAVTIPIGVGVLQPFAQAHWWDHVDYSQVCIFSLPWCDLTDVRTGETRRVTLRDLNADATLSKLWSHEGTIREALPAKETTRSKWVAWAVGAAGGVAALAAFAAMKG